MADMDINIYILYQMMYYQMGRQFCHHEYTCITASKASATKALATMVELRVHLTQSQY